MASAKMNTWTQIKVSCKTEALDDVCAVMSMVDSGLQIDDPNDIDRIDTIYGELIGEELTNADRSVCSVSVYIPKERFPSEQALFIRQRLDLLGIEYKLTLSGMDEEDWADSWKQYYKPLRIGKNLMIVPTWEKYEKKPDDIVILMDPGMAFGAGTHETTKLCASMLELHLKKGSRVLDVGTGSGILAICASKLGAGSVFAYDVDPVAVRVAKENVNANGCKNVVCGRSDLLKNVDTSEKYDFICANIVADIIVLMAPDVKAQLKKGGLLAVSGIIEGQTQRVKDALEKGGLVLLKTYKDNDWNAMLFTNED